MPKVIVKVINVAGLKIEFNDYTSFEVTIEDVKNDIFDAKGFKVAVLQIHNTTIVNSTTFNDDSTLQDVLGQEKENTRNMVAEERERLEGLEKECQKKARYRYGAFSQQKELNGLEATIADVKRRISEGEQRIENEPTEITVLVRMITGFKQFST